MSRLRFSTSAIDFELLDTWPQGIVDLLSNSIDVLAGYERRARQINRLIHHGAVEERWKSHKNVLETDRRDIKELLDVILSSCDLMGYHCTRLLPYEREEIIQSGLSRPSHEFFTNRIRKAHACGYLSEESSDRLLSVNQIDDPFRKGIWFVNLRSVLTEQEAVGRLFGSWGGEAIYNFHEPEPDTGPLLRSLGEPQVVVAQLPIKDVGLFGELSERFIRFFLAAKRRCIANSYGFESQILVDLGSRQIIDVVPMHDARFEVLTGSTRWTTKLQ
jgi:hypothetical protein